MTKGLQSPSWVPETTCQLLTRDITGPCAVYTHYVQLKRLTLGYQIAAVRIPRSKSYKRDLVRLEELYLMRNSYSIDLIGRTLVDSQPAVLRISRSVGSDCRVPIIHVHLTMELGLRQSSQGFCRSCWCLMMR